MNKNKIYIGLGISLLVVLSVVIFWDRALLINTQNVSVSLKWKHQAQFAGMYVADDRGYYRRAGLNAELKEFDFNTSQIDDLMQGRSDFALMSAEEFLLSVDEGHGIKAVAAFYQISPYGIVSLAETEIKNPADFLSKMLGSKGGKIEEDIFYFLLLDKFGISSDRVSMMDVGFEKREIDDLQDGDVDAIGLYRTDQLYFFEQEGVNYNIIYPELYGINVSNDILVTTNDLAENNPKLVEGFLKSSIKGWEYTIKNPNKAVAITLKYVTDDNYKDWDYEMYILNNSIPLIQPSTSQQIGYINPDNFDKLYKTMVDNNFLKTSFTVSDFYTNNFIK